MTVRIIDFSTVSEEKNKNNSNPLNTLGSQLRTFLWEQLQLAVADDSVTSIVLFGGSNRNFSAGADLTEFAHASAAPSAALFPSLIQIAGAIDACPKPAVACIRGACLGGGLEVALACHYRIAAAKSSGLGLPEVRVGVIPGAGGTQRLPRLIGLRNALSMILTGAPVSGPRAAQLKLVDAVVDDDDLLLVETAVKWALWAEVVMPSLTHENTRRVSQRTVPESPAEAHVLCHVASLSLPPTGNQGVRAALEACRASVILPFEQGMQREGQLFLETLHSEQGKARRHAFFAVRNAQKMTHRYDGHHVLLQKHGSVVPKTAVIGAGTMGGGIALVLLQSGFAVTLVDVSKPALEKGVATIQKTIESLVKRQKLSNAAAQKLLSQLQWTQNLQDLSDCQLVVEAVVENMQIKQDIFRTLDRVTPASCVLLSNTSTLDIDQMASVLESSVQRRRQFAGWHFFSPAHIMKLVEIVVGSETSPETVALLQLLTKRIGKIGVVVGNCYGFCGNRMLRPYSTETVQLLVEGGGATTTQRVDAAMRNFGMALGPFEMSDLAGNDVGFNIRRELGWVRDKKTAFVPPNRRPARYTELADDMVSELGRLGQKVGKGWYDYDPNVGKGRKPLPSPEMAEFVQRYIESSGPLDPLSEEEIVERVLYPLVNEGFKCLEEGIARSPGDIDVIYLYGYGWPAWRGGPMYWADHQVGLPNLLSKLRDFHRQFPETEHYVPCMLLERCVELGLTVEEYYRLQQQQQRTVQSKL